MLKAETYMEFLKHPSQQSGYFQSTERILKLQHDSCLGGGAIIITSSILLLFDFLP